MWVSTIVGLGLLLQTPTPSFAQASAAPARSSVVPAINFRQPPHPLIATRPDEQMAQATIVLERTGCFGFCPIYRVIISGTGRVTYEGYEYVSVRGRQTTFIDPEAVRHLIRAFDRIGYFQLPDRFEGGYTDLPSTITYIRIGGREKQVYHYMGSPEAPDELTELENRIDAIVNSDRWIGSLEEQWPPG